MLNIFLFIPTISQNTLLHTLSTKTKYTVYVNLVTIRQLLPLRLLKSLRALLVILLVEDIKCNIARSVCCSETFFIRWKFCSTFTSFLYVVGQRTCAMSHFFVLMARLFLPDDITILILILFQFITTQNTF